MDLYGWAFDLDLKTRCSRCGLVLVAHASGWAGRGVHAYEYERGATNVKCLADREHKRREAVHGGASYEPAAFVGTTPSYLQAHSH